MCYSPALAYCSKEAGTALRQTDPSTADKVGSYACVSCQDWSATGPKCKSITEQLDGLCSNRKRKMGECLVGSVSVERWEAMKQTEATLGTTLTAEYCEKDTKALCAFVGGAPKADACKADGPWCDSRNCNPLPVPYQICTIARSNTQIPPFRCDTFTTFGNCDTDAHCAARVSNSEIRCCDSDAKLLELWSAKVCDGVTIKGDDLVSY